MKYYAKLELGEKKSYKRNGIRKFSFPGIRRARKLLKSIYGSYSDVNAKVYGRTLIVTTGGA